MGSFLVKRPDGLQEMMRYESERFTASLQTDVNVLSRSRVRSRVVTTARSRRCSSYSLSNDAVDHVDRKRSVSCSIRSQSRERVATTAAFTWSPLPPRKGADKLCVALFCDDTWANMEEFEALIDSLPGNEMPTPSHSNASSTLRKRAKEEPFGGNLVLDDDEPESLLKPDEDLSSGEEPMQLEGLSHPPMRPFTNPRDTPTRHARFIQSPLRTTGAIGKEDLTLESLHDLEWLQRMEPIDQTILEAHIIWSILTLMVVLLACYSFQHHSL